jgi:hypothetical protein
MSASTYSSFIIVLCRLILPFLADLMASKTDFMADSAPAPGSRSTGLGKMVQYPRDKFYVAKWRIFCYSTRLPVRSRAMICLIKIGDIATKPSTKVIIPGAINKKDTNATHQRSHLAK